jgi:hypothetical protein
MFTVMEWIIIPPRFLCFLLFVDMASKKESSWSQQKNKSGRSEWKSQVNNDETATKFNAGKTQVDDILKGKSQMRSQWQNCISGSVKWILRSTGIQGVSKFVRETFVKVRCKSSWRWYINTVIMFLHIIHRLYLKHNVSETGFCLRRQVEHTQLGPIDRARPHLRTPAPESESESLYDYQFTANQFVLLPRPLRSKIRIFFN